MKRRPSTATATHLPEEGRSGVHSVPRAQAAAAARRSIGTPRSCFKKATSATEIQDAQRRRKATSTLAKVFLRTRAVGTTSGTTLWGDTCTRASLRWQAALFLQAPVQRLQVLRSQKIFCEGDGFVGPPQYDLARHFSENGGDLWVITQILLVLDLSIDGLSPKLQHFVLRQRAFSCVSHEEEASCI